MVAEYPQLGRDGLIDLPWSPPKLAAKAEGPIRYPIADFFLTNADLPQQPDDAALLGRAGAAASHSRRRRSDRSRALRSAKGDSSRW